MPIGKTVARNAVVQPDDAPYCATQTLILPACQQTTVALRSLSNDGCMKQESRTADSERYELDTSGRRTLVTSWHDTVSATGTTIFDLMNS